LRQQPAQSLERSVDAFLGGFLRRAKRLRHVTETQLVKKTEDDSVAVAFAQFGECAINIWQREFLKNRVGIAGNTHSRGLLFPMPAADLAP
jgi:hypothetical protein